MAKEIDSPEAFTAKILQHLVKAGIIDWVKGIQSGFYIPRRRITATYLVQIVHVIDGVFSGFGMRIFKGDLLEDFWNTDFRNSRNLHGFCRDILTTESYYTRILQFSLGYMF